MPSSPLRNANQQTDEPDKSYFSPPPTVSLPKGGGAIKGMGEKFAANPVTGTGSMSVPIATSPGRSGFGPQLSLSYDSGAGNGIFGMGWSLSLPSITRKTDKGLPRYQDSEASDVFILSGAEDLVPVLKKDGTVDKTVRDGYQIRKYRPRLEGLFARIERWTKVDSGETHWQSISKDNITTLYGKTDKSRIADPANPTHVFSWLICESYDDKGNAIFYRYKLEDPDHSVGINISQAHERNRTPRSRAANRYLKRIHYGNLTPRQPHEDLDQRQDWLFEAVFDYGEHDRTNPIPKEPNQWKVETLRHDPFSSYRSGFEVRTYRLCQRVLMFHHFPDEAGVGWDCLVRSTDFTYSYEQNPRDVRNPAYSFLKSVTQTGYKRDSSGGYVVKSLPPLEFTYSEAQIDETVREVDPVSLENLPQGLDGARYQWIDLDGEGLSGILTEQGNGWLYKRNLSPVNTVQINGKEHIEAQFAPVELVASKPASGLENGAQFLDLAGDGQPDVVVLQGTVTGFYERTKDERWESFIPFKSLPVLDWDNPNLKFIDLDGDGHTDILITEDDCFVWHPSLAEDGFGVAERSPQSWDEEKGPRVVFADGTQSIYLADMSGDGLTDIVRIRNGEVCYWANLGYGRFGAKVTMDNAPWFDAPDIFNQRRILLADVDGSGTTDILYLSGDGVQVHFNQSGNSWSAKRVLKSFPAIDNAVSVTTLDLLGNGTACLVWSSPLPGHAQRVMRYIDLMGGQKPHLLVKTVNNMGAETVVQYAPSTKFYLQDRLMGKPWITKLPFPVHVVERVETRDYISGNRFVTRYAYHHGYFDGEEREFRGFGMVEQWDTEDYGVFQPEGSAFVLEKPLHVPPILTKTWFHTGAYLDRDRISNFFAQQEYYREPQYQVPIGATEENRQRIEALFQRSLLPDTVLPEALTVEEEREACRSLKGSVLRQEVYALDNSEKSKHPYSVTESNYAIRLLQPKQDKQHAVFFTHPLESIAYHYERNPDDPRVAHQMTLKVDDFGNVLKSVAIVYPRRKPAFSEQGKTLLTYTENRVTNKPDQTDWYRIGVPIETRTYEITGLAVTGLPVFAPFQLNFIREQIQAATEIPYEASATTGIQKRVIEQVRSRYRPNSQANTLDPTCLPLGEVESLALPCESFKLAFTPGLLIQVYGSKIEAADLRSLLASQQPDGGGYVEQDDGWWIRSGRQAFNPEKFYAVTRLKDPFGQEFQMEYDPYTLLMQRTEDPLKNVIQIENDYRVLQPRQLTDPNGNRAQVIFDALGMVVGTAVMGKVLEKKGDNLTGFVADLEQAAISNHLNNPLTNPHDILVNASTRLVYDLERYRRTRRVLPDGSETGQPTVVYTLARETHVADLAIGEQTKVQHSFLYSDGFGREIQTKIQAEPGLAPRRDADGVLRCSENLQETNPRWVGTGRTIFNNKGKPVKQYEPFFSPTHLYENEKDLVECGVTPIIHYDPLGRVVRTDLPNGTFSKVEFDAWYQETWDENDTVLESQWHRDRQSPTFAGTEPEKVAERRAAKLTETHAKTPSIAHLDTLGRPFLTIADNGTAGKYRTHVTLDIEGNQRLVTDARNNRVLEQKFDLLGHVVYSRSMDAGDRWMLNNVAGKPIRSWDSRGFTRRFTYDRLQRPLALFVKDERGERLAEAITYGESQGDAKNHRGTVYQMVDGAGVVTNTEYDFKGNLLSSKRELLKDYRNSVNWLENPAREEEFTSQTRFDALNRPISLMAPDNSTVYPIYNEANLLNQVRIKLRGASVETLFIKNIDYNEKGQRTLIEYSIDDSTNPANSIQTSYQYDRQTFRLEGLKTTRKADNNRLQYLSYTYDPVGNITEIRDDAQQTIFFRGEVVSPSTQYEYDALYRLIRAAGREHSGQTSNNRPEHRPELKPHYDFNDTTRMNLAHPNNGLAMRNYRQEYQYDAVGNILAMIHRAKDNDWTRHYDYEKANNRLRVTSLPGDSDDLTSVPSRYTYDDHGNMTKMPHLNNMEWDFKDQLQQVDLGGGGKVYYVYDASGQRVRKVHEHNGSTVEEHIYLGGFEIYRKRNGSGLKLERETLHIMDDQRRIALVETKTFEVKDDGTGGRIDSPKPAIRYQLENHLGSASLELNQDGQVISYEEYYPYGGTSYQAGRSVAEVSLKRYRYTGKERDEETGLYYHGARYYAPWLGRWTSADPIGISDGVNLFVYTKNNPIKFKDPTGYQSRVVLEETNGWYETKSASGKVEIKTIHKKEITLLPPKQGNEASVDPSPDVKLIDFATPWDSNRELDAPTGNTTADDSITPEQRHLQVKLIGMGENFESGGTGAVAGAIFANWLAGVKPTTGDVNALVRTGANSMQAKYDRKVMQGWSGKPAPTAPTAPAPAPSQPLGAKGPPIPRKPDTWGTHTGKASGRPFSPNDVGVPIRDLSTEGVRITPKGIEVIKAHLDRFGSDPQNAAQIQRLEDISSGRIQATQEDLNFYTHELREYVRYRELGYKTGIPNDQDAAHKLWNDTHTATMEDYGISNPSELYHPSTLKKD